MVILPEHDLPADIYNTKLQSTVASKITVFLQYRTQKNCMNAGDKTYKQCYYWIV